MMRILMLALSLLGLTADNPDAFDRALFNQGATATAPAVRLNSPVVAVGPPPVPGVHGLPFAPEGMSAGDRVAYYRAQFGLPAIFQSLAWRESNYRNDVHTFCCWGTWQLWITLHLKDHRTGPRMREECNVFGISDIYGLAPIQEQKQACATAVLYSVVGLSPWR